MRLLLQPGFVGFGGAALEGARITEVFLVVSTGGGGRLADQALGSRAAHAPRRSAPAGSRPGFRPPDPVTKNQQDTSATKRSS
jgi:hypothetical protein